MNVTNVFLDDFIKRTPLGEGMRRKRVGEGHGAKQSKDAKDATTHSH